MKFVFHTAFVLLIAATGFAADVGGVHATLAHLRASISRKSSACGESDVRRIQCVHGARSAEAVKACLPNLGSETSASRCALD